MRSIAFVTASLLAFPVFAQEAKEKPQDPKKAAEASAAAAEKAPKKLAMGSHLDQSIALPDIDGTVHKTSEFKGKVTVVNFWSTTCPIMAAYEDDLKAIVQDYEKQGVVFLMINSNEANGEIGDKTPAKENAKPYQKIRDYLKSKELPYKVLVDHGSTVASLFAAKTTPDIFLFDKQGKLVYRGLINDDQRGNKGDKAKHYLKDALNAVIAGKEIATAETTPVGCTIKWGEQPKPAKAEPAKEPAKTEPGKAAAGTDAGKGETKK
jgi:thiol-disulfide isomerase/thioredoxin